MKFPGWNASSFTSTNSKSSSIKTAPKKEKQSTSPRNTSQRGHSVPRTGNDEPVETRTNKKRTSRLSTRSVKRSITRSLSNLSFKSPSSQYSKLPESSDRSFDQKNFGSTCGVEEKRGYDSSFPEKSSVKLDLSSSSLRSSTQERKVMVPSKHMTSEHCSKSSRQFYSDASSFSNFESSFSKAVTPDGSLMSGKPSSPEGKKNLSEEPSEGSPMLSTSPFHNFKKNNSTPDGSQVPGKSSSQNVQTNDWKDPTPKDSAIAGKPLSANVKMNNSTTPIPDSFPIPGKSSSANLTTNNSEAPTMKGSLMSGKPSPIKVETKKSEAPTLRGSSSSGKLKTLQPQSAKHAPKRESDVGMSAMTYRIESESARSVRPSPLHKSMAIKSSTPKTHCEASKTSSGFQKEISKNATPFLKSQISTTYSSSPSPKQHTSCKHSPEMGSVSAASGKRGLAILSGDRAKEAHPKPKELAATETYVSRGGSHALNTKHSSFRNTAAPEQNSQRKSSAGKNSKRVDVRHHHIVVPPARSGVAANRRPLSCQTPQLGCPICKGDTQANIYSRLGVCFECGSRR